jgi:hypothetical protein
MNNDYKARAVVSILDALYRGQFGWLSGLDPSQWEHGDAREVCEYAQRCSDMDLDEYQAWHDFPGGWPRFLDMYRAAMVEAERERKGSYITFIPLSKADEVLREK